MQGYDCKPGNGKGGEKRYKNEEKMKSKRGKKENLGIKYVGEDKKEFQLLELGEPGFK